MIFIVIEVGYICRFFVISLNFGGRQLECFIRMCGHRKYQLYNIKTQDIASLGAIFVSCPKDPTSKSLEYDELPKRSRNQYL